MRWTFTAITLLALAAQLVVLRQGAPGRGPFKLIASCGFWLVAWSGGASATLSGRLVLVGLGCGWLGDLLLLARGPRALMLGLGSFLAGHVAYTLGFGLRGLAWGASALAALAAAGLVAASLRSLWPRLPRRLRAPVSAYAVATIAVVATAAGSSALSGDPRAAVGAMLFAISDIAVARERLVGGSATNKLWGLPLYYGGQLLIAFSAGG